MKSRIVIAALSAAVMGIVCMAPIASQAQTQQPSSLAQGAPKSHSEGTALQAPKLDLSKVGKASGVASAQPTAPKQGEMVLAPVARR